MNRMRRGPIILLPSQNDVHIQAANVHFIHSLDTYVTFGPASNVVYKCLSPDGCVMICPFSPKHNKLMTLWVGSDI